MQADFNSFQTGPLWRKLSEKFGVAPKTECQETNFLIPSGAGTGRISSFRFYDGLSLFLFDGQVNEDWEWQFECEHASPLYIFFLISGRLEQVRHEEETRFELRPMETLMALQPGGMVRSIVFKAGDRIKLAVLGLKKETYLHHKGCGIETLPPNVQLLLSISDAEVKALFPPDRNTLETAILVQAILDCPHTGLLRACFVEAKTRELLFRGLQRSDMAFSDPMENDAFKKIDLEKIIEARNVLVSDLQNAPTIEELSRRVGLNRQKLKTDFKAAFGKTIFQYLTEARMCTAKGLFMQRNNSVQHVASIVGYGNPSHFSRRFQEQFGILPGKFVEMVWRQGQEN